MGQRGGHADREALSEHAHSGGEGTLPAPLAEVVAEFDAVDRGLRSEMLIEWADQFESVPAALALATLMTEPLLRSACVIV